MAEHPIGTVIHYWGRLGVAGIELADELTVGDTVHFLGATSDFTQTIDSIQIEHQQVESAGAGDSVGIKVDEKVRVGDQALVVTD